MLNGPRLDFEVFDRAKISPIQYAVALQFLSLNQEGCSNSRMCRLGFPLEGIMIHFMTALVFDPSVVRWRVSGINYFAVSEVAEDDLRKFVIAWSDATASTR
jgi:hypothetical protein